MRSGRKCKWKSVVKQIAKSVVCFVLCIALVFGYSYKPAQAMGMEAVFAGAAAGATGVGLSAVAGAAVVAVGLSALGIGVSALVHGESYGDACGRIWNNMTTKAKTDLMILGMGTAPIVHFGSDAIQGLNDSVSSALTQRATYDSVVSDGIPTGAMSIASGGRSVEIMQKVFPGVPEMEFNRTGELFDALSITDFKIIGKISPGQNLYFPMKDGKCLKLAAESAVIASGGYMKVYLYSNSTDAEYEQDRVRGSSIDLGFINKSCTHHKVPYKELLTSAIVVAYTLDGVSKIGMMVTTKMIHTEKNEICVPARAHWIDARTDGISVADSPKAIDDGPINVANDQFYARELSALNTKIDALQSRLEAAQGQKAGKGIDVYPPAIPVAPVSDDKWWDKIRSQPQDKVLDIPGSTVTDQDRERNKETNKERDTTQVEDPDATPGNPPKPGEKPKDMPDLSLPEIVFKQKFPFCLPWDIYRIVAGFYCSTTAVPKWTIPIKNSRLGINSGITIDFSQFESVAALARWFNGALWVLGLILISRKMIGAGGGD